MKKMRRIHMGLLALSLAVGAAGCGRPGAIISDKPSHVVFLPGIAGYDPFTWHFQLVVNNEAAGVSAQVWDWTQIEPRLTTVANLTDYELNRRRSDKLANELLRWRASHPNTRLYLVGLSGGTGIAIFACERLPKDFAIERIVLLSSALSPDYDLSPGLTRAKQGVWSYFSSQDTAILGSATKTYGTFDRKNCESGGLIGFKTPADPALAVKLHQLAWQKKMIADGNWGGHLDSLAGGFTRKYLMPLFETDDRKIPPDWQSAAPRATASASPSAN